MTTSIKEVETLTQTEKLYRINERLEEMYGSNGDWKNVLACKWRMNILTGGSL